MTARTPLRLRFAAVTLALLTSVGLLAQGPLTNLFNVNARVDANSYLMVSANAAGAQGPITNLGNLRGRSDTNGYLMVTVGSGTVTPDTICLDATNQDICLSRGGAGILTVASTGNTNNEDLDLDLETTANTAAFSSSTGVTTLTFTGITTYNLGAAGVRLTQDEDGALTFLGLGAGADEALTMNLDDVANEVTFSSSTAVDHLTFTSLGLEGGRTFHAPSIAASESYKSGLGVSIGTDTSHDIDVAAGGAQSFDQTHDIVFAAQAGKQLDVKWATGATAGMLGEPDAGPTATLTFSLTASPDTITSDESTFANCNALTTETGTVIIQGGSTNDGTYEVASCTDTVLTLGEAVLAGDETSTVGEYEVRYVKPLTWYHIYLIESAGTEDICADTNEIATNCLSESGYDQYKLLQSVFTTATANINSF